MGLISTKCEVCGRAIFHGGGIGGHYGSKSVKCNHCLRTMCHKCHKGPLCKECLNTAPVEIQKSCMKVKILVKIAWYIELGILVSPYLLMFVVVAILKLDTDELPWLFSIFGILVPLGMFGLCFVLIWGKSLNKNWYRKNQQYLPPYEGRY